MKRYLFFVTVLLALMNGGSAYAHFKLNLNVRILHVVHGDQSVDVYMRMPMSYIVADKLGPPDATGLPAPAPFTQNRWEDGVVMHLLDHEALSRNPLGLGRLAADAMNLGNVDGLHLAEVQAVRVHEIGREPGFATLEEAQQVIDYIPQELGSPHGTYVGDTVVDIHLRYNSDSPLGDYALSFVNDPQLPGQEDTANLILDYRDGTVFTYRTTGLMRTPVRVSNSTGLATFTFVEEGVRHILTGLDHVLFVVCLILGAMTLRSLVSRVTGFTVGHSISLVLGFFGFAPRGAWFIPTVETLIALSIILAAADAVLRSERSTRSGSMIVAITGVVGLVHGFGFSFMLQNILKVDAPNVWQSLLAFNIGVEIGQLLVVLALWPLVFILRQQPRPVWRVTSFATASCVTALAAIWAVDRASGILV